MSTLPSTTSGYSSEEKSLIKQTVASGATDLELEMFLQLAKATGLNPFKKEIWFIKTRGYTKQDGTKVEGKAQMMTGIDGFFRIANGNPNYDGVEHDYGPDVKIPLPPPKDPKETRAKEIIAPEWVESIVYRKDRARPERRRAYWREYAQDLVTYYGNLSVWAQKPFVMLEKCADATALRKAFPQELGDLYAVEEMPREYAADEDERKTVAELESEQRANYLRTQAQRIEQTGDYTIEFGNSNRGAKVSQATNSIWLERHLEKYKNQIPQQAQEIIRERIAVLKRDYARRLEEKNGNEAHDDGLHPTPEEEADILAQETEVQS